MLKEIQIWLYPTFGLLNKTNISYIKGFLVLSTTSLEISFFFDILDNNILVSASAYTN